MIELVQASFPIIGDQFRLELSDGPNWRDRQLVATVRLTVFDDDGSLRDMKEQELQLVSKDDDEARVRAFLQACTARVLRLTAADEIETLMPMDLVPCEVLAAPVAPDAFERVLGDARAMAILERRRNDAELLATLDPRSRSAVPVLREADLEARILERIDDPAAYAVYGDWLAEHGDPRGELVTLQIALAERHDDALATRARHLIEQYAWEWLGRLAWTEPNDVTIEWRYGFASRIGFGRPHEPSQYDTSWQLRELARLPGMAFVQTIDIGPSLGWGDDAFATIGEVGLPSATRRLTIETGEYSHAGDLEPAYPGLGRLEELRIESRSFELGVVELPRLRALDLVTRGLTRDNLESLRDAQWPALERLVLWISDAGVDDCDVELDALAWIFEGERLPAIKHLGLCGRADARELLERLIDAPIVARLEVLDLAGTYVRDEELAVLRANRDKLGHLRAIHLDTRYVDGLDLPNVVTDERFIPVYE